MDNIAKYFSLIVFTAYMRWLLSLPETASLMRRSPRMPSVEERLPSLETNSRSQRPLLSSWRRRTTSERWLRKARADSSGKETFLLLHLLTLRTLPRLTSRLTLERSSMTSTRLLTPCSVTCHRETTRREPSTDLLPRLL